MKNLEKIVPVAVAGLVLASAGTVNARAAEAESKNPDPTVHDNPETSAVDDNKEETSEAPSTEIKNVTPIEPDTDPDSGAVITDNVVNFDVDTDNLEATNDGTLTKTDTPPVVQQPTVESSTDTSTDSVENEDGSTTVTTTTTVTTVNEDGSVTKTVTTVETITTADGTETITTTTNSETTSTEKTETEITGTIEPENPSTGVPTDEDLKDLKDELGKKDDEGNVLNLGGLTIRQEATEDQEAVKGTTIGGFEAVDKSEDSEDIKDGADIIGTKKTTSVTFEKVVTNGGENDSESQKPLTRDELGLILGVTLTERDGKYFYSVENADGSTTDVEVVVDRDSSYETNTTTYRITAKQVTTVINDKTEGKEKDPVEDIGTVYDSEEISTDNQSILDILDKPNSDESFKVVDDGDGDPNTTTIRQTAADGSSYTDYVIVTKTTELKDDALAALRANTDNATLVSLLGADYTLDSDGNIVTAKVLDANGKGYPVKVEVDDLTGTITTRTMTAIKYTPSTDKNVGKPDNLDTATTSAEQNAALEAVRKAIAGDELDVEITADNLQKGQTNEDGVTTWTVEVTKNVDGKNKTFTYTVTTRAGETRGEFNAERVPDADQGKLVEGSGSTTVITGSAVVTGENIVWTETVNKDGEGFITGSGTVNATVGQKFGTTGETVKSISSDYTEIVTEIKNADGTTTVKTYTFDFNATISDEEKAALLAQGQVSEFTNLKKTSWTVEVQTVTPGGPVALDPGKTDFTAGEAGTIEVTKGEGDTFTVTNKATGDTFTLEKGSDGKYHNATDADDKAVYTIEDEDVPLASFETALKDKYGPSLTIKDGKITYIDTDGGVVDVTFEAQKKYTVTKVETSSADHANTDLNKLIAEIVKQINENPGTYTANGHELQVVDGKLQVKDGGNWYTVETTESQGWQWIKDDTAVNFDSMKPEDLQKYLESLVNSGYHDENNNFVSGFSGYEGNIDHMDLDSGSELKKEDGTSLGECVILYTDQNQGTNLKITLDDSAEYIAYGEGQQGSVHKENDGISHSITSDNDHFEFGHALLDNPGKSVFYHVEGSVGYNFVVNSSGQKVSFGAATGDPDTYDWRTGTYSGYLTQIAPPQAVINEINRLKNVGELDADNNIVTYANAGYVIIDGQYYVYRERAGLSAYGYMGKDSNNCVQRWGHTQGGWGHNQKTTYGYDLFLNELTLLEDGRVIGSNEAVKNYKVKLNKTTTDTQKSGASLKVTALTKDQITSEKQPDETLGGSLLTGSYEVTENRSEDDLKTLSKGEGYKGSDSFTYDTYQTWVAGTPETTTASGTRYGGTLNYSYTIPESTTRGEVTYASDGENAPSKTVESTRYVNAHLTSTATTTRSTSGTPNTVINRPSTPTPPTGGGGGGGTGGGGGGGDTTIDDEDVPMVDTPEIPEIEIPEDDVPMAQDPEVEIEDEEVPMADVPQTSDNFLLEALSLALSSASGLWLGLSKKRRS